MDTQSYQFSLSNSYAALDIHPLIPSMTALYNSYSDSLLYINVYPNFAYPLPTIPLLYSLKCGFDWKKYRIWCFGG